MLVIIGAVGLAIDLGMATVGYRSAQGAADRAALAGAQELPGSSTTARNVAIAQATLNGYTTDATVTVTVNSPPLSGPRAGDPSSVEVIIAEAVPTAFMRALNINYANVSARAVATSIAGLPPCGVYVMNEHASGALRNIGNARTTINGGCVHVNSDSAYAGDLTGNGRISATANYVAGGCRTGPNAGFSPPCTGGSTQRPDPLAYVPIPAGVPLGTACGGTPPSCSGSQTISPGVYDSITASGNGTMTLSPGVYIITDSVSNSGSGRLVGNGVMLYFACPRATAPYWRNCDSAQAGATLEIAGAGGFSLSAPTSGPYQGLLIFFDRNNVSGATIQGTSAVDSTTGTIYAISSTLTMGGNASSFASLIVADSFVTNGNTDFAINYDASQNYGAVITGVSSLIE